MRIRANQPTGYWITLVITFLVFATSCSGEGGNPMRSLSKEEQSTQSPTEAGFSLEELKRITAAVEAGEFPNTHALLIEHDGSLVYEHYFPGTDERWGDPLGPVIPNAESLHDLRSISKSVTSMLLGIALAEGGELRVERPVADYFPELDLGDSQRQVTLHHVLTMTAGFECNEMDVPYTDSSNDEIRLYTVPDPAAEVLRRPLTSVPGANWYYNGGLTQVVASVITRLTGKTIDEYAKEKLFGPLGITEFEWLGPGTWTINNPAAPSGLRLKARDLARIGTMVLNGGQWEGKQVVPAEWVERSIRRHVPEIGPWSRNGTWGYGYFWWVGDLPKGPRVIAGVGNGNQRLFILPKERLVVTIFAGEYYKFEGHSERLLDRILSAR